MLVHILDLVGEAPADMVRRDATFTDLAVDPATLEDASQVVDLLTAHPSLIQRPIAILGDRVVVARPSRRILELLDD
ncbi:MAG: ArsC/Spx/MgsR family protein [Actinomycetota bacterium]|nr:ArsC/Spx/MgsR family protein [Actinomycetota bacterium]